jgi:hypothetical protein
VLRMQLLISNGSVGPPFSLPGSNNTPLLINKNIITFVIR